jgi:hypothetical protein
MARRSPPDHLRPWLRGEIPHRRAGRFGCCAMRSVEPGMIERLRVVKLLDIVKMLSI